MPNNEFDAWTTCKVNHGTNINDITEDGYDKVILSGMKHKPMQIHLSSRAGPIYCTGYGIKSSDSDPIYDIKKW